MNAATTPQGDAAAPAISGPVASATTDPPLVPPPPLSTGDPTPAPPPTTTPTTPPVLTPATLQALADHQRKLQARIEAARAKMSKRDGVGCLAELDAHDKIEPRMTEPSTSTTSPYAIFRAECLMLAGQCAAGKTMFRDVLQHTQGATIGPETRERSVDAFVGLYCQGAALTGRDAILRASQNLSNGAYMAKKDPAFCRDNAKTLRDLIPNTPPKDEDDHSIINAPDMLANAGPTCLVKAGDCPGAWALYKDVHQHPELFKFSSPEHREQMQKGASSPENIQRMGFDAINPRCKGR